MTNLNSELLRPVGPADGLRYRVRHYAFVINLSLRRTGLSPTICWLLFHLRRKIGMSWPKSMRLWPKQVRYPLLARSGFSSDIEVFRQVFVEDEYACLRDLKDVRFILDLGANVGYSSAYFLSCFPTAHLIAVEPDEHNLEICRFNLRPYSERTRVLCGAVWDRQTRLCLSRAKFRDGREWATQVIPPASGASGDVQAWDIGSLIDMAERTKVDLLKIDIEGSELAVFSGDACSWLPRVRNLCIELHGAECQDAFLGALDGFDYELEYSGELTILRNIHSALS